MWIETQSGNFCNLGRATDIVLSRDPITKDFEIHACFADERVSGGGEVEPHNTLLVRYGSEADAKRHMKGLKLMVKAATCRLSDATEANS